MKYQHALTLILYLQFFYICVSFLCYSEVSYIYFHLLRVLYFYAPVLLRQVFFICQNVNLI